MNQSLDELFVPDTPYSLWDYCYGRCQIFALALHLELGYELEMMWDDERIGYDGPIGLALVHAYCLPPKEKGLKNTRIDIRGYLTKKDFEDEYDYNVLRYQKYSEDALQEDFQNDLLDPPASGEIEALQKYIRRNVHLYR